MDERNEEHFDGKVALKAVIEHDGKVLLVRDPREGEEVWEIPGGRMNVEEEPQAALVREVKEELGIDILVHEVIDMVQFWQFSESRNAFLITFHASLADPQADIVMAEDEIAEVKWATEAEVGELQFFVEYKRALEKFYGAKE